MSATVDGTRRYVMDQLQDCACGDCPVCEQWWAVYTSFPDQASRLGAQDFYVEPGGERS